uniref:Uncharacterized protein n=1 Tax=Chelonoidis abingdonii TaxID=106734 RepID=A0A8C0GQE2_CHEAB
LALAAAKKTFQMSPVSESTQQSSIHGSSRGQSVRQGKSEVRVYNTWETLRLMYCFGHSTALALPSLQPGPNGSLWNITAPSSPLPKPFTLVLCSKYLTVKKLINHLEIPLSTLFLPSILLT